LQKIAGYWRWVSMHIEFADGAPNVDVYGSAPEGGVVITPGGRLMAIAASSGRQPAQTDDDRVALFRSFAAYTGQARLEDDGRFVLGPVVNSCRRDQMASYRRVASELVQFCGNGMIGRERFEV
jgi:Lipocalin-like domain